MPVKKNIIIISILFTLLLSSTLFAITRRQLLLKEIELEKEYLNLIQDEVSRIKDAVARRKQVEKLQNEGRIDEIKRLFAEDFGKADSAYKQLNYKESLKRLGELKYIYKQPFCVQDIVFLKAKISIVLGLFQQSDKLLNTYVTKYSEFPHFKEAQYLLQFAQFNLGKYEDIVALDKVYKGERDNKYNFILANAYYCTGEFQKAFDLANELISKEGYKFDSQFLTGLCIHKIFSNEDAINYFQTMIDNESVPERLEKLYLTIARVYYSDKNYIDALVNYKNYIKMVGVTNIGDDILYEMGWCALKGEENLLAGKFFKKILDKKPKSKLYDEAKFSLSIIFARLGSIDEAVKIVEERISENENIANYVKEKEEMLKLYKEITVAKGEKDSEKAKKIIAEQEKELQEQLYDSNIILSESLGEKVGYDEIIKLAISEEEIISHILLLEEYDRLEKVSKERGKQIFNRKIDRKLAPVDSLLREAEFDAEVNIILTNFLYIRKDGLEFVKEFVGEKESLENIKEKLVSLVISYVHQKYDLILIKENLVKDLEKARTEENTELVNKIQSTIIEVDSTIAQLDKKLGKYFYGQESPNEELKQMYINEQKIIRDQREKLKDKKVEIVNKLEEKVIKIIAENKNGLSEEKELIDKQYNELMANLKEVIQQKIEASHYALSDLLLERQAIINENYSATQSALTEQQKLYRKLLNKIEEQ